MYDGPMSCCHYYAPTPGGETAFAMDSASVTFGPGVLAEAGEVLRGRLQGRARVALFTDRIVGALPHFALLRGALAAAGLDVAVYDEVQVEPGLASFLEAARFVEEGRFDACISLGGGSVIDTCKAALLYATYPAEPLAYVGAPLGGGVAVPGPLPLHVACPTTCGTGSECTGIAVCSLPAPAPMQGQGQHVKAGIAHRALRPTLALVDPRCAHTLPGAVVATSGCDVLSHALESYTAQPYTRRRAPAHPGLRPMSQGANPFSDMGCLEALRRCGRYLLRAATDAADHEAREGLMYAATLAGLAFGNAGVHVPHGMAYAVAGLAQDRGYRMPGYPQMDPKIGPQTRSAGAGLAPHGLSVILSAPAAFRHTALACPERHLEAAAALGADTRGAGPDDAGEVLVAELLRLMQALGLPSGLAALGCGEADLDALAAGAALQERLLGNAPLPVREADTLTRIFRGALRYW